MFSISLGGVRSWGAPSLVAALLAISGLAVAAEEPAADQGSSVAQKVTPPDGSSSATNSAGENPPPAGHTASAAAAGATDSAGQKAGSAATAEPLGLAAEPLGLAAVVALERLMIDTIAACERSVVSIARVSREAEDEPASGGDFRRRRFGGFEPVERPDPTDASFVPNEFATGVVIDASGLILTNHHVVDPESEHWVTTVDRQVFRTTIVASDPKSDLAVLRIEGEGKFEPIRLGDASGLKKGQIVVALGNPYAIARDGQASASWGIISNLSRKAGPDPTGSGPANIGKDTLHHFGTLIQTDARLNLGTSGGPLLNLKGEMIGLTTSLAALSGYEQAAGYAIPVDATFRRVLEELKQGKEVEYGFLGIGPMNLPSGADGVRRGVRGARVKMVKFGMPAHRAGIETEDIIVAVNGRTVFDTDSLLLEIGRQPAGAEVTLDLIREGDPLRLRVTLAKAPVTQPRVVSRPVADWRGLRVDYSTALPELVWPELFDGPGTFSAPTGEIAVAAWEVVEGSPAWRAGLRKGTLITHVQSRITETPADFARAIRGATGPLAVRVIARGSSSATTVTVDPE